MCFSASASFGASAIIGAIGVLSIIKAKTTPLLLFASIPFIFSIQQLAEGLLWLSLNNNYSIAVQQFFVYSFLFFAMVLWPVWIPVSMLVLEKNARYKKIKFMLLITGIIVAAGSAVMLLLYPVNVVNTFHHLHYKFNLPVSAHFLIWAFNILYFVATVIPPFISGIKKMYWLGIIFLLSCFFAVVFYDGFIVSVWCYFAALLSIVVLIITSSIVKQPAEYKAKPY